MSRYVCSDSHGNLSLWNQIKEYLKPEDQLWFLGDAADRGNDGWTIIKELLLDPRVTYIKGNHEDMLVEAMVEYIKFEGREHELWHHLVHNGGYYTFQNWVDEGAKTEWIQLLRRLPHHAALTLADGRICHLSHAGFSSDRFDFESPTASHDLLWDRNHINDDYEDDTCWVIHGHTPVIYLAEEDTDDDPAPIQYGNKVDIDMGTPLYDMTCLFDIDKWEPIFFKAEVE